MTHERSAVRATNPAPLPARVPQTEIAAVYERVAGVYDIWGWLTESRARRRCLELAAVRDGEALLAAVAMMADRTPLPGPLARDTREP